MNHVSDNLAAYLAAELSPADRSRVENHLKVCADCRAECDKMTRILALLGDAPGPLQASRSVWPAVRARTTARGRRMWPGAGWAAAALVAGVLLGVTLPGSGSLFGAGGVAATTGGDDPLLGSSWLQKEQGDDLATGWLLAGTMTGEDGS